MPQPEPVSPADLDRLFAAAREAAVAAYAPYSHFAVGAAVLDDQGRLFAGCNVENVSFGLTICAERHAVGAAVLAGARKLLAAAVYTPTAVPTSPCGACRQVLAEFGPTMTVYLFCDGTAPRRHALRDLLPESFGAGESGFSAG
ncbi:MAG TPA: cytidine deaminase [Candidatus Sumerlaeota bacterium]|nr:MAG: Cytidine deaminase [candidate division BRC1 bacterium ADurb.BinA292]HOE95170.1 cytidine deaminase [Candidatus Sumerlaeota bacterium]HPK01113.1 cytidine deaminase [Candidatus Sumerlaeota bacterium]